MIRIQNISKRFGTQVVLDNVSLEIPDGKTTAIVGPSGVGKSVLLKLIIGILKPDSGKIFIGDDEISSVSDESALNEIRKSLGVLFQHAALFDSLTVYENIEFPLKERLNIQDKSVRHRKVVEMLESLSLTPYAFSLPQELSLGMCKRVGLARSLITQPKVLLFDEPNTGLDPWDGQEVYDLIKECKRLWGFTGIVISHEIPEVFQVSDQVVMLLNGRIAAQGTPGQIMESQDPAVKQFLSGSIEGPIKIN